MKNIYNPIFQNFLPLDTDCQPNRSCSLKDKLSLADRSAIEAQKLTYRIEKGQLSVIGCEIILQKKRMDYILERSVMIPFSLRYCASSVPSSSEGA